MKFTDGQWLIREGYTVYSPHQVHDYEIDGDSVTIQAPCRRVEHRVATILDGPLFAIRFSSPLPDVIRVQIFHHTGRRRRGPEYALNRRGDTRVEIAEDEGAIRLRSGDLSVRIAKGGDWAVDFYQGGRRITGSGFKCAAYILAPDGQAYLREQLDLGVGECVYGLGERFTPFVKNGQGLEIWNEDGGTSSEQAYKSIPFYLTNRGYGVFVNDPGRVSYEVASERVSKVQFSVAGESLDYCVIGGPTPKRVLENYTALTGRPALPPAWSFGLWLSTSFTTDYNEKTVTAFIDGMAERDLPLAVFHFDCFWMREYHWCDFQWDERIFPEPAKMLARLKEKGLHVCVWINPYIAQQSRLFAEGRDRGYLLRRENGDVWQWDRWQAGMGIVDFTNPEARRWYASYLEQLMDMGVDCFKTDFGERIPTDVVYSDGSDPERMHNYYAYLYNKTVFEAVEKRKGKGGALVFARSAAAGSQQFPVHWGGDCWANFDSMAESLRGGLSLCLSGFGFWSHDIGGFEETASADVYKRWVAFGLLSSHSRLHGSTSYRVPWLFDEEAVDVVRFFTKLKCGLMPYLFAAAKEASDRGIPVMRAMMLEFPGDPACDYLDRQYMLGEALLVAPIFSEEGTVDYYLPEGTWTNFLTGEKLAGGCWRRETHGYLSLPLMARPNSVVAVGGRNDRSDYDYADGVTLHLFELEDGKSAGTTIYGQDGSPVMEARFARRGKTITAAVEGASASWRLLLRGITSVAEVNGGSAEADPLGTLIRPGKNQRGMEIRLG